MNRRKFLYASLPAVLVGISGCSSGGSTSAPNSEDTPTATAEPTATSTAAQTDTEHSQTTTSTADSYGGPASSTSTPTADGYGTTDSPTSTATETPSPTSSPEPSPDLTITVGPNGSLRFKPETFSLSVGETIRWEWASGGHNVSPDDGGQPAGADWVGDDDQTYASGHSYTHTFATAGEYSYHCDPHQSIGMRGSFTVE